MKRTILLIGILLITSVIMFSLKSLSSKENENKSFTDVQTSDPDEFLIGAYHVGCASNNPMQELGLNMWHRFLDQYDTNILGMNQSRFPKGFTPNDKLFSNISSYQGEAVIYYNSASQLNNNYLYLTRPKIEMLSFAQRSDYHPFNIGVHALSTKGNWWYGYAEYDMKQS